MLLNTIEEDILEPFVKDYRARLTGSQIAKKHKLNQKTVANYLNRLEGQHILKSATEGKNKLFRLNIEDEIIIHFISAIESQRTIRFYKKHPLIKEIMAKSMINGIAIIFGSYAKGTQDQDSDLDLFIVGQANKKEIEKLGETYKIEINIKQYSQKDLKRSLQTRDPLTEEIIKDHIIIKNNQEFITLLRTIRYGTD